METRKKNHFFLYLMALFIGIQGLIHARNPVHNTGHAGCPADGLTAGVTVHVALSCTADSTQGTTVQLTNNAYPDTVYIVITDVNGTAFFPAVLEGAYTLSVNRYTYEEYIAIVVVSGNATFDITLMQITIPPSNLSVDGKSLVAQWNTPFYVVEQFYEDWNNGYAPNQWTEDPPNSNWSVYANAGMPSPCARFTWSPVVTNYHQKLTSGVPVPPLYAPLKVLEYVVNSYLYLCSTVEYLTVELWDGTSWNTVDSLDINHGNYNWENRKIDITGFNNVDTYIRFNAQG